MEIFALEPLYIITLLFVGICTGIISGLFGIGGGAIIVPTMILLGNDIKIAVGISIMQMMFSSLYGSYVNYKKKNLDLQDGLYVGLGGLIGASFSGMLLSVIPSHILEKIFVVFLVYCIFKVLRANANGGENKLGEGMAAKLFLVAYGSFVGVFAISLGIGGAIMLAPVLAYYLGYSSKKIAALSLFFVVFSSISGFTSLAMHGFVDFKQGFIIGIATLIGVRIGIWILGIMEVKKHKYALLTMYCILLFIMLEKAFF